MSKDILMPDQPLGAFGKIPGAGDFLRLSGPEGFVEVWDDWLQSTMLAAAEAFGAEWDARYMSAPIWRFTLSPGLAGPAAATGVLMPSVDRVGRRFPLTLMMPLAGDRLEPGGHFERDDFFTALEDLALAALEDGFDRAALAERLQAVTPPESAGAAGVHPLPDGVRIMQKGEDEGTGGALLNWLLLRQFPLASLWSTTFNGQTFTTACAGLPGGSAASTLFDPAPKDQSQGAA